ncbi:MAG: response regulator transcription factor [Bdellovibrionales bacterium]|nr:response regulator transcription factor [Bdellovibrionales bacterium]
MPKERILVVEDEADIRELIQYNLQREGFEVLMVGTGEEALSTATQERPDLILLDLMLPGMNGLDVCRSLKSNPALANIPILIVSARGEETDVVTGLELGADDYLTKPFSPRVLVARARAVLRRRTTESQEPTDGVPTAVSIHGLRINPRKHEAHLFDSALNLTATEFRILHFLAKSPGWVFTRQQIVETVHGDDYPVTERSIDVQIAGLRKKLGESSDYIETVRGIGYRMKE